MQTLKTITLIKCILVSILALVQIILLLITINDKGAMPFFLIILTTSTFISFEYLYTLYGFLKLEDHYKKKYFSFGDKIVAFSKLCIAIILICIFIMQSQNNEYYSIKYCNHLYISFIINIFILSDLTFYYLISLLSTGDSD